MSFCVPCADVSVGRERFLLLRILACRVVLLDVAVFVDGRLRQCFSSFIVVMCHFVALCN